MLGSHTKETDAMHKVPALKIRRTGKVINNGPIIRVKHNVNRYNKFPKCKPIIMQALLQGVVYESFILHSKAAFQ